MNFSRFIALTLILCMFAGTTTLSSAAVIPEDESSPYASAYLTDYTAWAVRSPSNQVYVYYDVTGAGTVGCLGAKLIVVQMKDAGTWKTVKTYTGTTSNGMLAQNMNSFGGNIVYQGTSGTQYRAVVTIFGGSSTSNGDSRIITTNTV